MISFLLFCRIESLTIVESTDTFSTIYDFLRSNIKLSLVGVGLFPIFDNL
jgi:hypothetical protein